MAGGRLGRAPSGRTRRRNRVAGGICRCQAGAEQKPRSQAGSEAALVAGHSSQGGAGPPRVMQRSRTASAGEAPEQRGCLGSACPRWAGTGQALHCGAQVWRSEAGPVPPALGAVRAASCPAGTDVPVSHAAQPLGTGTDLGHWDIPPLL